EQSQYLYSSSIRWAHWTLSSRYHSPTPSFGRSVSPTFSRTFRTKMEDKAEGRDWTRESRLQRRFAIKRWEL
ncbi:unnamed protein product, partial [Nesidiocoris tenuis]